MATYSKVGGERSEVDDRVARADPVDVEERRSMSGEVDLLAVEVAVHQPRTAERAGGRARISSTVRPSDVVAGSTARRCSTARVAAKATATSVRPDPGGRWALVESGQERCQLDRVGRFGTLGEGRTVEGGLDVGAARQERYRAARARVRRCARRTGWRRPSRRGRRGSSARTRRGAGVRSLRRSRGARERRGGVRVGN